MKKRSDETGEICVFHQKFVILGHQVVNCETIGAVSVFQTPSTLGLACSCFCALQSAPEKSVGKYSTSSTTNHKTLVHKILIFSMHTVKENVLSVLKISRQNHVIGMIKLSAYCSAHFQKYRFSDILFPKSIGL